PSGRGPRRAREAPRRRGRRPRRGRARAGGRRTGRRGAARLRLGRPSQSDLPLRGRLSPGEGPSYTAANPAGVGVEHVLQVRTGDQIGRASCREREKKTVGDGREENKMKK